MDEKFLDGAKNCTCVLGIGIDLADVARIRKMLEKYSETFLEKTFTRDEIEYCQKKADPAMHFAARFAAKEAISKALGCGISEGVGLKSIWITNDALGAPQANFDENVRLKMNALGAKKILVSLTHLRDFAQAMAILSA